LTANTFVWPRLRTKMVTTIQVTERQKEVIDKTHKQMNEQKAPGDEYIKQGDAIAHVCREWLQRNQAGANQ